MQSDLRYITFGEPQESYKVVILVKESLLNAPMLLKYYVEPIIQDNPSLTPDDFVALNIRYNGKKAPVNDLIKPWLNYLASCVTDAKLLLVADSPYFKVLTGTKNTAHSYGSVVNCTFKGFEDIKAVITSGYSSIHYDAKNADKITLSNKAISASLQDKTVFDTIIKHEEYPEGYSAIKDFLTKLLDYPELTCDIETFGLNHTKCGLGTIAFAWDKHSGGAFCVEYATTGDGTPYRMGGLYALKNMLKEFFIEYILNRGNKIVWHNIGFDAKVLVWELFANCNHSNKEGILEGLNLFTNMDSFEDTKLISYVATNSAQGNDLKLKTLALPFAGNYALDSDDIKDILQVPREKLLTYNLIDCLSTWYVKEVYGAKMIKEDQEEPYLSIIKPSVKVLMQAELHGMPLKMDNVFKAEKELVTAIADSTNKLTNNPIIINYIEAQRAFNFIEKHHNWVKKILPLNDKTFDYEFNPNSSPQLILLLYDMLDLPILETTDTGQPSCSGETLEHLISHTDNPDVVEILECLQAISKASKILTSFIPAFKDAYYCPVSNWHYLMGNFNLGGTVSGRLSCSNPNLQQIPSGSFYAKLIKECFIAPEGYLFVGLDFNSLEDYISALTTKDPNKLKVYLDGYDGHCLRAYTYFKEKFPNLTDSVEDINSIKITHGDVRQDSKAPTFALTYQGTWHTLMKNCGFTQEKAQQIENNFKELYKVSIKYVDDKLEEASNTGFIYGAFKLKVRTPLIQQSLWGTSMTPYEAIKEGRTAGNALGQSYCLLNNRAGIEFQERTLASDFALDIWPTAHIHDAQYFMVKEDLALLHWMNKHLVECVQWQDLPEIRHDKVKLGGEFGIFYPSWAEEITIPNNVSSPDDLQQAMIKGYEKNQEKKKEKASESR